MKKQKNIKTKSKSVPNIDVNNSNADALNGCSSIDRWEIVHGRGFWGSEANGYIYDKDNK